MPHFVTSRQNEDHVTSANEAHLTAGLLGNGCYVLPIGQKLACTMTDSNTLRVLFGVASVCGRQWEIEGDYEEVNIDNGVPGYNRTDLLVCRIETAPQEAIALKVYKGEETTGEPVVQGHVEGDLNDGDTVCEMPICSVRVNGINPQAPKMLAEESIDIMALLQELRDYKSQCPHRVGQLYLSFDATSPEKIWPGTKWEQVTGHFLRAANDTATGGSDTVTLTTENMPSHTHTGPSHTHGAGTLATGSSGSHTHDTTIRRTQFNDGLSGGGTYAKLLLTSDTTGSLTYAAKSSSAGSHTHSISGASASAGTGQTGSAGGGNAFSIMPKYQNVYAWRRTA